MGHNNLDLEFIPRFESRFIQHIEPVQLYSSCPPNVSFGKIGPDSYNLSDQFCSLYFAYSMSYLGRLAQIIVLFGQAGPDHCLIRAGGPRRQVEREKTQLGEPEQQGEYLRRNAQLLCEEVESRTSVPATYEKSSSNLQVSAQAPSSHLGFTQFYSLQMSSP